MLDPGAGEDWWSGYAPLDDGLYLYDVQCELTTGQAA